MAKKRKPRGRATPSRNRPAPAAAPRRPAPAQRTPPGRASAGAGAGRTTAARSGPGRRPDRLRAAPVAGTPAIVRGASWGFSILLVGELVLIQFVGIGNGLILYVLAAAAYALAGNRAVHPPVSSVGQAARDGALAAALAYGLTIPLRLLVHSAFFSLVGTAVALLFAVLIGGLAGSIVGRARLEQRDRPA